MKKMYKRPDRLTNMQTSKYGYIIKENHQFVVRTFYHAPVSSKKNDAT